LSGAPGAFFGDALADVLIYYSLPVKRSTMTASTRDATPPTSALTARAPIATGIELPGDGAPEIVAGLRVLVADIFALYVKTKNFHWHVQGPHFREHHLLFDEQAGSLLAVVDAAAERARKLGGTSVHSIGEIARLSRVSESELDALEASRMLSELEEDNRELVRHLRDLHEVADRNGDVATTSLVDVWIDEAERRVWFLAASRG